MSKQEMVTLGAKRAPLLPAALWAILAAALVLRLAMWLGSAEMAPATFDEREFRALANNLLERSEYAIEPGKPTSLRPPLYPATVAAVFFICGKDNYQAVRLVQITISLLTSIVVFFIALELFGSRVALWAAALCSFYPSLLGHSYLLLTEVLFTFLLCVAVYCLMRFLVHGNLSLVALGGVFLGLAALTRSVMWIYPPIFMGVVLWASHLSCSRRLLGLAVFALSFALILTPWAVRNTRLQGTLTIVDVSGGRILRWALGGIVGPKQQDSGPTPASTQGEQEKKLIGDSLGIIATHPLATLAHMRDNFLRYWGLERELVAGAAKKNFGPWPRAVVVGLGILICGYYLVMMLTALVGLVAAPPESRLLCFFLLSVVMHICLIHTLVYGHSRYHITSMPIVMLFSASALARGRDLLRPERRRRLWLGLSLCGVFLALLTWRFFVEDSATLLRILGSQTTS